MMGCDHPSFIQIGPLVGELCTYVIVFPAFCNMAAVRHLELEFCHSGQPNYAVQLPCQNLVSIRSSPPEILWFYNLASLVWKCLTTPLFGGFWGFEPLKIVGHHPNPQKAHPWVTTRHLSDKRLKSVQGCDLGASPRKKYNQDRTIKKVIKRISPIWGQAPRKAIAIKFGTGVDVHEVVTWAKFNF